MTSFNRVYSGSDHRHDSPYLMRTRRTTTIITLADQHGSASEWRERNVDPRERRCSRCRGRWRLALDPRAKVGLSLCPECADPTLREVRKRAGLPPLTRR